MKSIKCLSGNQLKMIAVISMLIDHTAVVFIERQFSLPDRHGGSDGLFCRMAADRHGDALHRTSGFPDLLLSDRGGLSSHKRCKKVRRKASGLCFFVGDSL